MATIVKAGRTVRYYDPETGRQREKTLPSRQEAKQFKAQIELDIARGTFVDPKLGSQKFKDAASSWLARHPGTPKTHQVYESALRLHVLPAYGNRTLTSVANDREGVELWVRGMQAAGQSSSTIRTCYLVLTAVINDAIKAGKLHQTRIRGIKMPEVSQRAEFEFADPEQITELADRMPRPYGFAVYLMYGCGLRLGEALGVRPGDFIEDNAVLRVQRQMPPSGEGFIPLKHRGKDSYRDVPVPRYVSSFTPVEWLADGGFQPITHRAFLARFHKARNFSYGPDCTPHALRHMFASQCLAAGIPITDVSKWLGHRDINTTYATYGHLVSGSFDRARDALDKAWSA
jgi:integrase